MVYPGELTHERVLTALILLDQHQLELTVDVLNDPSNFFILQSYQIISILWEFVDMHKIKHL